MSRHRHVQNLDYEEEYDEACDEAVYGRSVDDHEYGVSPSVEDYIYTQNKSNYGIGAYFAEDNIEELNEEMDHTDTERRGSTSSVRPRLSSEEETKVNSILDEMRNAVGDQFSDTDMVRCVLANNFNFEKSLDSLLNLHIAKQRDNKSSPVSAAAASKGSPFVPDFLSDSLNISYMAPISYSLSSAFNFNDQVKERIPVRKLVKEWHNEIVKSCKNSNLTKISKGNSSFSRSSLEDSSTDHSGDKLYPALNKLNTSGLSDRKDHSCSSMLVDEQDSMENNIAQKTVQNRHKKPIVPELPTSLCTAKENAQKSQENSLSNLAKAHLSKFNSSSNDVFIIPPLSAKGDALSTQSAIVVPKTEKDLKPFSSGSAFMALANAHFNKVNTNNFGSSPNNDNELRNSFEQMSIGNAANSSEFSIPTLTGGSSFGSPYSMSTPRAGNKIDSQTDSDDDIDLTVALMRTRPKAEEKPVLSVTETVLSTRPSYSPERPARKLHPLSDFGRAVCKAKLRRKRRKIAWTIMKSRFRPFDFKSLSPDELFCAASTNKVRTTFNMAEKPLRKTKLNRFN